MFGINYMFKMTFNLRDPIIVLFFTIVLIISAISDIRLHKIPNWLTYSAMIVGLLYHTCMKGLGGLFFSIEGLCLGIAFLVVPYLMGVMGAGDTKLMGVVGGFLGPKGVFIAFLCTSVIGGIYAMTFLFLKRYLGKTAQSSTVVFKISVFIKNFIYIPPPNRRQKPQLCYGLAIALGAIVTLAFLGEMY